MPEESSLTSIDDENLAAQRASAEAIAISRATLETTLCQEEQLEHCDVLRERHQYIVDKSTRIVKGMTWSGWFANAFTKDVQPPPDNASHASVKEQISHRNVSHVLGEKDNMDVPQEIEEAATIVKNLECNVILLEQCQSKDEFDVLLEICKRLTLSARNSIARIQDDRGTDSNNSNNNNNNNSSIRTTLGEDEKTKKNQSRSYRDGRSIQILRKLSNKVDDMEEEQHKIVMKQQQNGVNHYQRNMTMTNQKSVTVTPQHTKTPPLRDCSGSRSRSRSSSGIHIPSSSSTTTTSERTWSKTSDMKLKERIEQQDEHLDALSSGIQELLHNGASIGISLEQQNTLLEQLNDGTDELTEKSKMVSRRADRFAHRSLWRKPKPNFKYLAAIQHVESKKFLSVEPQNKQRLALHENFHPDMSAFEVYERSAEGSVLVGLMNKCTRTWLGQSALGFIVCNARKFGQNEEWELDSSEGNNDNHNDMNMAATQTKILCASANWGNGGWLMVDEKTEGFSVGGYDAIAKKKASLWSVVVLDEANS